MPAKAGADVPHVARDLRFRDRLDQRGTSFETALRGFLRVRDFLNATDRLPHAEERLRGASRSTHDTDAALVSPSPAFSLQALSGGDGGEVTGIAVWYRSLASSRPACHSVSIQSTTIRISRSVSRRRAVWARAWRNTLAVASSGAATRTSTPDAQARTAQEIRRAGREANRLGGKVGSLRRPAALRSIV